MPDEVLLGIDLGTSSVKAVLLDLHGVQRASAQVHYPVDRPRSGWAEQDPERWWRATVEAVRGAVSAGGVRVTAVGLSGQMHGLVLLDGAGAPVRPAIIWSDTRSTEQVDRWNELLDPRSVEQHTGFPISPGMTGTSLAWVRDHEPEAYQRARTLVLPKDYIRYRLTGEIATEPTDAGGSLLYDLGAATTFSHVFRVAGLREDLMPPIIPSLSVAGRVHPRVADETGIPTGTPVAAGGGDQSMAAIALGLDAPGRAAIAISSGGTVFKRTAAPLDPALGLHVMPHALPDQWLAMGVVLSAGLAVDWMARKMFGGTASPEHVTALMSAAADVAPGAQGLLFSSQLGGTRTPRADSSVRGSLYGLGYDHGQAHITRALVEGVCVSLSRTLGVLAVAQERIDEIVISGGAARFPLWRQTLSDVTALPVRVSSVVEHSALGAAVFAGRVVDPSIRIDLSGHETTVVHPDPASVPVYRDISQRLDSVERAVLATMPPPGLASDRAAARRPAS